jgi:hypothetical protein
MTYDFSQITEVKLGSGSHESANDGLCFMEMAAWFAGEEHSDKPDCACPVLGAYGIRLNDAMPDDLRDRLLKPLVPQIVGTRDKASEQRRAKFLAMWAINKVLPIILRLRGFESHALACEKAKGLSEAKSAANAAYAAADAAAAAAYASAADAAAAAAYASAADAAANAANAAYAANDAANAAAYAANAADAADAAAYAANAAAKEQIFTVSVDGLREAIKLGRNEGLMIDGLFAERREKLRELGVRKMTSIGEGQ